MFFLSSKVLLKFIRWSNERCLIIPLQFHWTWTVPLLYSVTGRTWTSYRSAKTRANKKISSLPPSLCLWPKVQLHMSMDPDLFDRCASFHGRCLHLLVSRFRKLDKSGRLWFFLDVSTVFVRSSSFCDHSTFFTCTRTGTVRASASLPNSFSANESFSSTMQWLTVITHPS